MLTKENVQEFGYIDEKYKRVLVYDDVFFDREKRAVYLFVYEVRFFEYSRRWNEERFFDFGADRPRFISISVDDTEIMDRFGSISDEVSANPACTYVREHWLDYAKAHLQPYITELDGKKIVMVCGETEVLSTSVSDRKISRKISSQAQYADHDLMTKEAMLEKYGLQWEQLEDMLFSPYYAAQGFRVE